MVIRRSSPVAFSLADTCRMPSRSSARSRMMIEPQPVQAPFAAGIDQPVAYQRLQDVPPTRAFARVRQAPRPEPIKLEQLIQLARKPACAPLPRPMQLHAIKPHLHAMAL